MGINTFTSFSWQYASASRSATWLAKKLGYTTSPAPVEFQLLLLKSKPVSDLFPAEGYPTSTVTATTLDFLI